MKRLENLKTVSAVGRASLPAQPGGNMGSSKAGKDARPTGFFAYCRIWPVGRILVSDGLMGGHCRIQESDLHTFKHNTRVAHLQNGIAF
ncbi:MAG: hypothetical protein Q4D63_03295 [Neisseria animaloris]|uniref:hypothetical protein n=1 Tax=Neisseria animaloris TaxID=326522 RepID=UPI00131C8A6D|nr:hypothetical protein [Neisseria animaloris]MDO5073407.1 hypothetical protein [Neisseria animaloris]